MILRKKEKEEGSPDLGFGSYVASESRKRFINRDGSFNVARRGLNIFTSLSLYHWLLSLSWVKFIALASLAYAGMNVFFALLYLIFGPEALQGPRENTVLGEFFRAFFFSVQTSSTIGYGHIVPGGTTANLIVTVESFVGLLGLALITGLVFARFSRPSAKILFSKLAVVAPYRDITGFMFRIANIRKNQIIELEAQVIYSWMHEEGGERKRNFQKLELERRKVPFFPLSWTIVHPITRESPLFDVHSEDLIRSEAEFMILLTGIDDTFNQPVHARSSFRAEEVIFNARFKQIYDPPETDHAITIDISRLSDIDKL